MRSLLMGMGFGTILLVACAATWQEPSSWTYRADGHIRASQRHEDFADFADWRKAYLAKEQKDYGVLLTPGGVDAIAAELAAREAEITQLKNRIANGCQ